jgi:hypothetical protein
MTHRHLLFLILISLSYTVSGETTLEKKVATEFEKIRFPEAGQPADAQNVAPEKVAPTTHAETATQTEPLAEEAHVIPLKYAVSLRELAQILARRLQDRDALNNESFDDEATQKKLLNTINTQIMALKAVLQREAPELYEQVIDDYNRPTRAVILKVVGTAVVIGGGAMALCSYNPITGKWEFPSIANAHENWRVAYEKVMALFASATT